MRTDPREAKREEVEAAIVEWRTTREARLAAEKVASKIKENEDMVKSWLLDVFIKQRYEGMVIDGRITGLTTRDVPVVGDRKSTRLNSSH